MMLKAPCRADEQSWDQDPSPEFTPHPPVHQLIHACVAQCPILQRCTEYVESLADFEKPYGVVAGVYRPWPGDSIVTARSTSAATMRAVHHLQKVIAQMQPGDRMPTIRQVMDDLTMSRNPVRAAYTHLVAQRVLVLPRNRNHPYTVAEPLRVEDAA